MIDAQILSEQVREAAANGSALAIQGGNSKAFYGRASNGTPLALADYRGVIDYTPSELVISARAGTPLSELESTLADQGQMLAFEPPHFGPAATLGGTIACGLSGPRRPYAGAARDFVLGVNCINGRGELLRLGGQVMKNVAGYDLSRTLTGSLGTLAVLLDVHLKVLPKPQQEITLYRECSAAEAVVLCNRWAGQAMPLSGACHYDEQLVIRLSGSARSVDAAAGVVGGEQLDASNTFWQQLREQQLTFFTTADTLWRLSLPPASKALELDGKWLLDWGGAQRWLATEQPVQDIRDTVAATGGHAMLFRGGDRNSEVFHPLPAALLALHQRIKQTFDPSGILNPGRMYREV